MSKFYKQDKGHKGIVEHLEKFGVAVYDMAKVGAGIPDLLVYMHELAFLELKETSKAQVTRPQIAFLSECKAPVGIATTPEEALRFALEPRKFGLNQAQKDKLAGLLVKDQRKKFEATEISRILEI